MSAILSADDLNDFISPGLACIKPVELLPPAQDDEMGEVEIQIDDQGNPLEISKIDEKTAALSPAQISLADCLACLGCITSAEEVLVAQHSHDQLLKALREGHKTFVASISHQSRASLAHAFGYEIEEMDRILCDFFVNKLGFRYVVGTALGRKLSLLQESQQMIQKKKKQSEKTESLEPSGPVLSSVCPGWVLYAEKTHPYVLPYMSSVKSPQQITGCLLKTLAASELAVQRDQIYHLLIMPCFDKKLESARPEVVSDFVDTTPDVDCVLTAKELINLVEESEFSLFPKSGIDHLMQTDINTVYQSCAPPSWPYKELSWANDSGSQSGGYAHNYLQITKSHLLATNPDFNESDFSVITVEGRNSDIYEMQLMHKDSKIASAAVINGFRNIQNLVRKLKPTPGKTTKTNPLAARRRARVAQSASASPAPEAVADASKCDYVEIMACPSGCINGGGQISPGLQTQEKEWLDEVKEIYNKISMVDLSSADHVQLAEELKNWSLAFCDSAQIPQNRLFATHFNEVEKPTDPNAILLGAKW